MTLERRVDRLEAGQAEPKPNGRDSLTDRIDQLAAQYAQGAPDGLPPGVLAAIERAVDRSEVMS